MPTAIEAFAIALLGGLGWGIAQIVHDLVSSLINLGFQYIAMKKQEAYIKKMRQTVGGLEQAQMKAQAPTFLED